MEFLKDIEIGMQIVDIVNEANSFVILVSPYVKPWRKLVGAVEQACSRNVMVHVIVRYGDDVHHPDKHIKDAAKLAQVGATIYALKNLHAKIYANETHILYTSMNLVEGSFTSSFEQGVLCTAKHEKNVYQKGMAYIQDLTREATAVNGGTPQKQPNVKTVIEVVKTLRTVAKSSQKNKSNSKPTPKSRKHKDSKNGYCIRCGDQLSFNLDKPLCSGCYREWAQYQNPSYTEEFCHICGDPADTSLEKPACYTCYRKHS